MRHARIVKMLNAEKCKSVEQIMRKNTTQSVSKIRVEAELLTNVSLHVYITQVYDDVSDVT